MGQAMGASILQMQGSPISLRSMVGGRCTDCKAGWCTQGHEDNGFPPEADALLTGAECWHHLSYRRRTWGRGAGTSGACRAHHASCALAAVLQAADVLPGTVGLQPCHQCLQRATVHKLLPMEDVLIQEESCIPARGVQTREGLSSAPSPTLREPQHRHIWGKPTVTPAPSSDATKVSMCPSELSLYTLPLWGSTTPLSSWKTSPLLLVQAYFSASSSETPLLTSATVFIPLDPTRNGHSV